MDDTENGTDAAKTKLSEKDLSKGTKVKPSSLRVQEVNFTSPFKIFSEI